VIFILAFLGRTARDEPTRHERVRELFVLLSAAFLMYARLCYEPAYVWAAGMMLLPSSGSKQRP
jgi:hypothetical protein